MTINEACEHLRRKRLDEAEQGFREILCQSKNIPHALNMLGLVEFERGNFPHAISLMEASILLEPGRSDYKNNLAAAYRIVGDFPAAERLYREAIAISPGYAEAYHNFVATRKFTAADSELELIECQLASGDVSRTNQCFYHFAAGKICDDIGHYERAIRHFEQGNLTKDATFDMELHRRFTDETIETFDGPRIDHLRSHGKSDRSPIFVIGMPRSGTSLVEQILASHPDVRGAGELPDVSAIAREIPRHCPGDAKFPQCMREAQPAVVGGFADAYLRRVRGLLGDCPRIVDKMPGNFAYIGLIAAMFPEVTIIHCRRHELDVCLSNFCQRYRVGNEWSYSWENIAGYYVLYEQVMRHWLSLDRVTIYELGYERLVEDQENETRRLLAHCGLDWHAECLEFHRSERPVTTASSWQVRQPLIKSRRRRYEKYEAFLAPLKEALARQRVALANDVVEFTQ